MARHRLHNEDWSSSTFATLGEAQADRISGVAVSDTNRRFLSGG